MNFTTNAKILIIGEGNFTFARSLCTLNFCKPEQLLATCFEREDCLTATAKDNSEVLKNKGASVLFNIDGRKLETYFDSLFSFIVFNFPHCGGKMKIQKNRQLLKEFFQSAARLISQDGFVYVSLCSGQGGIPLDTTLRSWNDTWQIVSMATFGDLILSSVNLFNTCIFADYVSAGYRSLEKGFHQDGSILYKFSKNVFIPCNINPLHTITLYLNDGTTVNIPEYTDLLIKRNIFSEKRSFIYFTFKYIVDILKTSFNVSILDEQVQIILDELPGKLFIRDYLPNDNDNNNICVYPLMLINTTSKELIPFCAICATEYLETSLRKFNNMNFSLNVFNKSKSWSPYWRTFSFSLFSFYEKVKFVYFVNLKKLSSFLFDLQYHELWSKHQDIQVNNNGVIVYQPHSLFPPVYSFHLSFWIPNNKKCDMELFHSRVNTVIINTVQDALVNCSFLGNYNTCTSRVSETWEITYCSFDKALSKQKVKELHEDVGRRLQLHLNCEIR